MDTGIYCIEHLESGKKYIGSAVNFGARWRVHKHRLRHKAHDNKHLQRAWDRYGEAAFVFKKLLVCSKENLLMYEQRCIDGYKSAEREAGYNASPVAGSNLGYRHTNESRAKIRAARAKQVFSAETRALWSKNRTGRKMPLDFAARAAAWKTGQRHSAATRAKIGASSLGRKQSVACRERKSKLCFAQVEEIRNLCAAKTVSQAVIAAMYNVDPSTISNIKCGKRWNGA